MRRKQKGDKNMSHCLYFVLIEKNEAENSQQARECGINELNKNGFVHDDKYFRWGHCDWFVVGGRWSKILSGKNENPTKDPYLTIGHEDDAMILTKELLENLKEKYGTVECFMASDTYELEVNEIEESHIDNYWIVVIDYHC